MEAVTLLLAATGCLLVLLLRPVYGLAVYVILSMWYPYCVGTVSVGTIDFSVGRIVIIALFVKIFLSTDLARKFKVVWLDRLVVILFVAEVLAGFTTTEPMRLLEYRSGDFFDMALPYFVVRLIIRKREHFITFLKIIAWSVALLAVFGIYESLSGRNLLKLGRSLGVPAIRLNYFYRAQTTFRVCIYYGIFSAMVGVLSIGLLKNLRKNKFVYRILIGLIFLGAFSSMSSGAQLTMVGGLAFIGFYRYRRNWRGAIIGIVLMCGLVEIISNRHFYSVIGRFTFSSSTAWYRARLFEVAFFEGGMSGHWLTGHGFEEPGWGLKIDTRDWTDIANHYLLQLCRYGLVGFIPFCAVIIAAIKKLFEGFWRMESDEDRWLIWCVAGGMMGVLLAFHTVSLFGQPMIMLFIIFGFCGVMQSILVNRQEWDNVKNARCQ
ncbi:MAG: hypothetical protein KAI59_05150 [Planctomycetes bacterium]|nr:hypothetical protein [Planctomycetota bacterium]MCK5473398.1 hypothetical protein [Planctomycetota bacterium]